MRIDHRPAGTVADLMAAASLLSAGWRSHGPQVATTAGDLQWWYAQAWPGELHEHLELWTLDGDLAGWSWADDAEWLDWHVRPDVAGGPFEAAIVAHCVERNPGGTAKTWAADGAPRSIRLLTRSGFRKTSTALSQYVQPVEGRTIPPPVLHEGYRLRTLAGDDIERRVEVHRAAFAPSKMTIDKYRRLMSLPGYSLDRDFVVEAPDGSFAAFTLGWWDEVARVGELEPVGTHPDHRRLGLGRAVNFAAIRRFAQLGARWAVVFSGIDNTASEALYRSVGFERFTIHRQYERPAQ